MASNLDYLQKHLLFFLVRQNDIVIGGSIEIQKVPNNTIKRVNPISKILIFSHPKLSVQIQSKLEAI